MKNKNIKTGGKFLDELFGVYSNFQGYINTKNGAFYYSNVDDDYTNIISTHSSEYVNNKYKEWKDNGNTNEFLEKDEIKNIPSINTARKFLKNSNKIIDECFVGEHTFEFHCDSYFISFNYKENSFRDNIINKNYILWKRKNKLKFLDGV